MTGASGLAPLRRCMPTQNLTLDDSDRFWPSKGCKMVVSAYKTRNQTASMAVFFAIVSSTESVLFSSNGWCSVPGIDGCVTTFDCR